MSYEPVKDSDLVAVVTFLEMLERPVDPAPPAPLSLWRVEQPSPDDYRALFRIVGSYPKAIL